MSRLLSGRPVAPPPPGSTSPREPRVDAPARPGEEQRHQIVVASSRYRQKALASCICRGVRHSASKIAGAATSTHRHFARDVATLSLLALYRNSMPRGASAWLDVAME